MDLWIRSQDRKIFQKVNKLYVATFSEEQGFGIYDLRYDDLEDIDDCDVPLGFYKSKKRALEVLDDISKRIKNSYIVEVKPLLKLEDVALIEETLNIKYDGEFIMQPQQTEIKPINSNLIYYEMPKE